MKGERERQDQIMQYFKLGSLAMGNQSLAHYCTGCSGCWETRSGGVRLRVKLGRPSERL